MWNRGEGTHAGGVPRGVRGADDGVPRGRASAGAAAASRCRVRTNARVRPAAAPYLNPRPKKVPVAAADFSCLRELVRGDVRVRAPDRAAPPPPPGVRRGRRGRARRGAANGFFAGPRWLVQDDPRFSTSSLGRVSCVE